MPPTDKPRKSSARPGNRDTSPPPAAASRPAPRKKEASRSSKGGKAGKGETQASLPEPLNPMPPPLPETAIRALRDIPGLGPIRIRALEKAGLSSLTLLRGASLEELLTVPGMSEIKARHIQTFLANALVLPEPTAVMKSAEGDGTAGTQAASLLPTATLPEVHSADGKTQEVELLPTWLLEMQVTRNEVIALLTSRFAPDFRARLLREMVRFAAGVPGWQQGLAQGGEKDQERALRRVRRLRQSLAQALPQPEPDRKTQSRLAEDIAEASDRLYALSGQTEPTRSTEDGHE